MNEIERIKNEGWLPESFFKEEVICDYRVDESLKQLWAVSLDMLKKFISVCDKHNLRWWADGGTVLGAIRHNGFIPWDDDVDVAMPREDYEKFKLLTSEFEDPYFLQTPDTDPTYGYSLMRIRNSKTTWYIDKFKHCGFNQGVWLSIFPYDNCKKETFAEDIKKILEKIMESSASMKVGGDSLTERDFKQIEQYYKPGRTKSEIWHEIENLAMRYKGIDTDYLGCMVFLGTPDSKSLWPKHIFDNYIVKDFYGLPLKIPAGWEEYLTLMYGDWKAFPPVEERGLWHGRSDNCNPLLPYEEVLKSVLNNE